MFCSIGNVPEITGTYALLCFAIIFVFLVAVVLLVRLIGGKLKKSTKADFSVQEVVSTTPDAVAPGSSGEMTLFNVTEKEAAMVIAIVADELGTPVNELKFLSIKKKVRSTF